MTETTQTPQPAIETPAPAATAVPEPPRWQPALAVFLGFLVRLTTSMPLRGELPTGGAWYQRMELVPGSTSITDMVLNVVVYGLYGLLFGLSARRSRPLAAALAAGFSGGLLSLALELSQELIPGRISSGLDVFLNGLGAFTGAALATRVRPAADQAAMFALRDRRGPGTLVLLYVILLVVMLLWPVHLSISMSEIAAGVRVAALDLVRFRTDGWEAIYAASSRVAWLYLPLGLLLGWRWKQVWTATLAGLVLALGLEGVQIVAPDHVASLWQAIGGGLGTAMGALFGAAARATAGRVVSGRVQG